MTNVIKRYRIEAQVEEEERKQSMTFGEKIRELRKAKNLTLSQLADLANLSVMTLSKIENNRYNPSILTVGKLANIFDAEHDELWRLAKK